MTDDESHATGPAPQSLFDHAIDARVGSLESSRKTWGWIVGLVAPAMFATLLWAVDRVQASAERLGESRATIESFKHALDTVDQDIRELRGRIMKLTGEPPSSVGVVAIGVP